MKHATGLIVTLCLLVSASAPAKTQSLEGTLKKVKETATITIGHRDSSIPLSYLDNKLVSLPLPLQSSLMSKTYLKSDHFNGGGSARPGAWLATCY
jgi:hypothetical protein